MNVKEYNEVRNTIPRCGDKDNKLMKKPFWCYIHHKWIYIREFNMPFSYGPFDLNKNRTKIMQEHVCARCGKKRIVEPAILYC